MFLCNNGSYRYITTIHQTIQTTIQPTATPIAISTTTQITTTVLPQQSLLNTSYFIKETTSTTLDYIFEYVVTYAYETESQYYSISVTYLAVSAFIVVTFVTVGITSLIHAKCGCCKINDFCKFSAIITAMI